MKAEEAKLLALQKTSIETQLLLNKVKVVIGERAAEGKYDVEFVYKFVEADFAETVACYLIDDGYVVKHNIKDRSFNVSWR